MLIKSDNFGNNDKFSYVTCMLLQYYQYYGLGALYCVMSIHIIVISRNLQNYLKIYSHRDFLLS